MRQSTNVVNMQGILNEIGIEERIDSSGRKYISGRVTLLVDQAIYGDVEHNEIQVSAFSYEMTKAGGINPSYASLKKLIDEGVSVAAVGGDLDKADRYRISGADLRTNEFDSKDGRHIVYPEVRASFFSKVTGAFEPVATFEQEIYILEMSPEEKDDMETGRFIIKGAVVGYNDRVDIINYIVENPQAIEYIRNNWGELTTVHVTGKIRATVTKVTRTTDSGEMGFGEPIKRTFDRVVKEYVITAGSPPIENGFDPEEMANAIAKKNNIAKAAAPAPKPINRGF